MTMFHTSGDARGKRSKRRLFALPLGLFLALTAFGATGATVGLGAKGPAKAAQPTKVATKTYAKHKKASPQKAHAPARGKNLTITENTDEIAFVEGGEEVETLASWNDSSWNSGDDTYTVTVTWGITADGVFGKDPNTSISFTLVNNTSGDCNTYNPSGSTASGNICWLPPYEESGDTSPVYHITIDKNAAGDSTQPHEVTVAEAALKPKSVEGTCASDATTKPDGTGKPCKVIATEGVSEKIWVGNFDDHNRCSTKSDFLPGSGTNGIVIDWGDGSISYATDLKKAEKGDNDPSKPYCKNGSVDWKVYGVHKYAKEGDYYTTLTVTDGTVGGFPNTITTLVEKKDKSDDQRGQIRVIDAPLTATCATGLKGTAGKEFTGVVATFTDADTGGTSALYSATIDWGDGSAVSAGTIGGTAPGGTVTGTHTYAKAGTYNITVVVSDKDGAKSSVTCSGTKGFAVLAAVAPALPKAGVGTSSPDGTPAGLLFLLTSILGLVAAPAVRKMGISRG